MLAFRISNRADVTFRTNWITHNQVHQCIKNSFSHFALADNYKLHLPTCKWTSESKLQQ